MNTHHVPLIRVTHSLTLGRSRGPQVLWELFAGGAGGAAVVGRTGGGRRGGRGGGVGVCVGEAGGRVTGGLGSFEV
jgi:hypothetical protein